MKNKIAGLILITSLIVACNVGVKTDLVTGFKTSNNGLSYEKAILSSDSSVIESNNFEPGSIVKMHFIGVEGFVLKDGKVNVGASIFVTDSAGNKLEDNPDLFEAYTVDGISPENVKSIDLYIPISEKYKTGESYFWQSKIWDKNGKGVINGEIKFVVK